MGLVSNEDLRKARGGLNPITPASAQSGGEPKLVSNASLMGKAESEDQAAPEISFGARLKEKTFAANPEQAQSYWQREIEKSNPGRRLHVEADPGVSSGTNFLIKSPSGKVLGETDPQFTRHGFSFGEFGKDVADVAGDVGFGALSALPTAAGAAITAGTGGLGLPVGAALSGIGMAGSEFIRQGLGKVAGVNEELDPTAIGISGALGAAIPVAGAGAKVALAKISPFTSKISDASKVLFGGVRRAESQIEKQALKLEATQAKPEADLLRGLATGIGTDEGKALREGALMSPLTREEKNAGFFNATKNFYENVKNSFGEFEKDVRFKEAALNLQKQPIAPIRAEVGNLLNQAHTMAETMIENPTKYDSGAGEYLKEYTKGLADTLYNPQKPATAFDLYMELNKAKKQIATLANYGKEVNPKNAGTIQAVQEIEHSLTGALTNEDLFGAQAVRHGEINEGWNEFLTALKNMQKTFTRTEAAETGRPVKALSSTSIGTYSRQLDTIHGADRRGYLDTLVAKAQKMAGLMDESMAKTKAESETLKGLTPMISKYKTDQAAFAKEMTWSNQLRRLRWDEWQQLATGKPVQAALGVAEKAASFVPGAGKVVDALKERAMKQLKPDELIRNLLQEEQRNVTQQIATPGAKAAPSAITDLLQSAGVRTGAHEVMQGMLPQPESAPPMQPGPAPAAAPLPNPAPIPSLNPDLPRVVPAGGLPPNLQKYLPPSPDETLKQKTGLQSIQAGVIQDPREREVFAQKVQEDPNLDEGEKMRASVTARRTGKVISPAELRKPHGLLARR